MATVVICIPIYPYRSLYIPIDPYRPLFMAMVIIFADTGILPGAWRRDCSNMVLRERSTPGVCEK